METLSLNKAFKNPSKLPNPILDTFLYLLSVLKANSASIYSTRYGSQYGSLYRTNSRLFKGSKKKNKKQKRE